MFTLPFCFGAFLSSAYSSRLANLTVSCIHIMLVHAVLTKTIRLKSRLANLAIKHLEAMLESAQSDHFCYCSGILLAQGT